MQNAAYVYSQVGNGARASELYRQYLDLDPANVPVRLKVAYDMAQAGLMKDAIDIIQTGLQFTENDVDLLQSLGDYALRYSTEDSAYVDVALQAYTRVLEIKGEATDLGIIENAIAAYTRAGRTAEAIAFSERALQSHADSPRLWSLYADALAREDRYAEGVRAMDRVVQLDPAYPNAYLKRGQLKLLSGDEAAALTDLNQAIQSGAVTSEDVFRLFWSQGHSLRSEGKYADAGPYFERALRFAPAGQRLEVEFWWAYTFFQLGEQLAKPEEATLNQLQRAQQSFTSAKDHFARAGSVRREIPQLAEATDRWLLNVEARIRQLSRGG
jgi:tetratricopeptide (TPR) repeat protein